MSTVGVIPAIAMLLVLVGVIALGVWAIRQQNRTFPKGSNARAGTLSAVAPAGS